MLSKAISTERFWVRCTHCGAKTVIYDNNANCNGVFMKCNRGCKKEFEIIIEDGKQVFPAEKNPE